MPELFYKCMSKRCNTRASGVFRVTYKNGNQKLQLLCADCGMSKVANHVACYEKDGELVFYHDVYKVDLIKSFTTDFVPPPEKQVVPSVAVPVKVIKSRGKAMRPLRPQFVTDPNFDPKPEWLR